jgi:tRNA pseudouridine38-40 synthase
VKLDWVGNGFLRYQVRIMTGTLVDVGLNRTSPDDLEKILADRDRESAGRTAPAHGLTLRSVEVGDGPVETSLPTSVPG